MAHLVRFRVSRLKAIQIDWPHVFAFLLSAGGIVIEALKQDLTQHVAITWMGLFAAVSGPIWMLFLQSIVQPTPPTDPPTSFGLDLDDRTIPAPPPTMKYEREFGVPLFAWASVLLCGLMATVVVPLQACTPVDQAVEAKIEQTVLDDFLAGKTIVQIETDVAALVAEQPGADVVAIVNDILGLLVDLGKIPPNLIPKANAMRLALHPIPSDIPSSRP